MRFEPFDLERWLATKRGRFNLSGLGPPAVKISEIINPTELDAKMLYGDTRGSEELRALIAGTYPGVSSDNVLATSGTTPVQVI